MSIVSTVSLDGLTGTVLALTATVVDGPPGFTLAGVDNRELRDRVYAALSNSRTPHAGHRSHVQVRLDPSSAHPDAAAVAVAVLAAQLNTASARLARTAVLGEVGLDGSLRPSRGALPAVRIAREHGIRRVIVPLGNLTEAGLAEDVMVLGAHSLTDISGWLRGDDTALQLPRDPPEPRTDQRLSPLRALTTSALLAVRAAAAGGHHLLLDVTDTAATLVTARWLHALLPALTPAQRLELAEIRSLAQPHDNGALMTSAPPMVRTHFSHTAATLLGTDIPGEVSLAHHGLLVADELDQFDPTTHEALRTALRNREVALARGSYPLRYPAGFQLFATSVRAPHQRRPRLPLALLDTIDIRLRTDAVSSTVTVDPRYDKNEEIAQVLTTARAEVTAARARTAARWSQATVRGDDQAHINATVPDHALDTTPGSLQAIVREAINTGGLSRTGGDTILRLAWTLADLDGTDEPHPGHVEQAIILRSPARPAVR
jgi:magnesium chelatase family protein